MTLLTHLLSYTVISHKVRIYISYTILLTFVRKHCRIIRMLCDLKTSIKWKQITFYVCIKAIYMYISQLMINKTRYQVV